MKKLLLIILLIVGCDNSTEPGVNPLVGIWEGTELKITQGGGTQETYQMGEDTDIGTVTYIFGVDGIYSHTSVSSNGIVNSSGTWSSAGGKLTLVYGDKTDIMDFTLSGNILTHTTEINEDDMTTTMVVTFIRQ